ncbi:MAG: DUF4954 family protein [Candidatus Firestonebacteria bacterium]
MINNILKTSELVNELNAIKNSKSSILFSNKIKSLTPEQLSVLKYNGNFSLDWEKIKVAPGFDASRIKNSNFYGDVILGKFDKPSSLNNIPTGIYNATIIDSEIGNDVLIMNTGIISNYIVQDKSVIFNCGEIRTDKKTSFGNGIEILIALETGGREISVYAEITIPVAEKIAKSRFDKTLLKKYTKIVAQYEKSVTSNTGVISKGVKLINTPKIINTYIGEYANIDNAQLLNNVTILSDEDEPTEISDGAIVSDSIVQWGCNVTSMAVVEFSVLTEHSHVESHGTVKNSIIGPNTGVSEGEVISCLLGPFVGFHHQALLISALWPLGKGNISYGANIGSNHTSRTPDQELWIGEGVFFGLGCNIKFPSDFTYSPYTIIATGVDTLPQKLLFPFSLVNSPSQVFDEISPAYNEIFPGWILSNNIFMIKRNEGKYIKRNKAKRTKFVFEVFRPEIINMMVDARKRLQVKNVKEIYTDRDITGLGKNYMSEDARKNGIEAYTFYIKYYALLGLKTRLEYLVSSENKSKIRNIMRDKTGDKRWEHEKKILILELTNNTIIQNLKLLIEMQKKIAKDIQVSKEKDDMRGRQIIEDYDVVHTKAKDDSFVRETWRITKTIKLEIKILMQKLKGAGKNV